MKTAIRATTNPIIKTNTRKTSRTTIGATSGATRGATRGRGQGPAALWALCGFYNGWAPNSAASPARATRTKTETDYPAGRSLFHCGLSPPPLIRCLQRIGATATHGAAPTPFVAVGRAM
eukprot:2434453-Pyramimonas_sp.AAC.1